MAFRDRKENEPFHIGDVVRVVGDIAGWNHHATGKEVVLETPCIFLGKDGWTVKDSGNDWGRWNVANIDLEHLDVPEEEIAAAIASILRGTS